MSRSVTRRRGSGIKRGIRRKVRRCLSQITGMNSRFHISVQVTNGKFISCFGNDAVRA